MMSAATAAKVGRRGTVVIPAALRKRFGFDEGTLVLAEAREDGVLLRPAVAMPVEIYDRERQAEFLLSNAVDEEDYASAREAVCALGVDPDAVPHYRPGKQVEG